MRLTLSLILITLLGGCSTPTPTREKAQLHLALGTSQMEQGDYASALSELLIAEKIDPRNPSIQNNLALTYFARERYALAEERIRRALDLDPRYTEARNNLGRIEIELGHYDEAIRELKKVLEDLTYKSTEKAYYHLGLAYFRKGEFGNAETYLNQAIKVNRNFCPAQSLYGRTLFEEKQFGKASESLDAAVETCQEDFDEGQYFNALSQYKLGRKDKAVARFEELLKLYPRSQYVDKARSLLKIIR